MTSKEEIISFLNGWRASRGTDADVLENLMMTCDYNISDLKKLCYIYTNHINAYKFKEMADFIEHKYGKSNSCRLNSIIGLSESKQDRYFKDLQIVLDYFNE